MHRTTMKAGLSMPVIVELRRLLERAREILIERHTEPTEAGVMGLGILYGLFLLLPFDSFTSPVFRVLLSVAPEAVWGCLSLGYGLAMLVGIAGYSEWLRSNAVFAASGHWLFVATSAFLGSPLTPAWVVYSAVAGASIWAFIRVQRRQRE